MTTNCDYCRKLCYIRPIKFNKNKTNCCSIECSKKLRRKNAEKTCPRCKNIYFGQAKTCSKKCSNNSIKIIRECLNCNKKFKTPQTRKEAKFCSLKCYHKNKTNKAVITSNCFYCNKEFGRKKSLLNRGKHNFCSKDCSWLYNRGKNHFNWIKKLDIDRDGILRRWSLKIRKRDNYTCQICGETNKKYLEAHHIKEKALFPEVQFDLNNGITLCIKCHLAKHINDKTIVSLMKKRIKIRYNEN